MIRDFNIEWLEAKEYIPAWDFHWLATAASGGATDLGGVVGADTGAPITQEVAASGLTGIQIGAAGDMFATIWPTYNVDRNKQIRFRVIWSQTQGVVTDSITWIVTYLPLVMESTTIATPTTALSTAIPALDLSHDDPNAIQASGFGVLNRGVLADTAEYLALRVEADDIGTFSANEVTFLGLEVRYTPRRTAGPRRNVLGGRRLVDTRPLGVQLNATQEGL